ncbi:hypothetical protein LINPERPRIM_LOCUS20638 [Linum perenne]
MTLAWDKGIRKLRIQTDMLWLFAFLTRDWEITLHHIYREANNVAYFLSNSGLEFELGISVFTYPWNTLIEWISYDLLGICLPRQINIIQ